MTIKVVFLPINGDSSRTEVYDADDWTFDAKGVYTLHKRSSDGSERVASIPGSNVHHLCKVDADGE